MTARHAAAQSPQPARPYVIIVLYVLCVLYIMCFCAPCARSIGLSVYVLIAYSSFSRTQEQSCCCLIDQRSEGGRWFRLTTSWSATLPYNFVARLHVCNRNPEVYKTMAGLSTEAYISTDVGMSPKSCRLLCCGRLLVAMRSE